MVHLYTYTEFEHECSLCRNEFEANTFILHDQCDSTLLSPLHALLDLKFSHK